MSRFTSGSFNLSNPWLMIHTIAAWPPQQGSHWVFGTYKWIVSVTIPYDLDDQK